MQEVGTRCPVWLLIVHSTHGSTVLTVVKAHTNDFEVLTLLWGKLWFEGVLEVNYL